MQLSVLPIPDQMFVLETKEGMIRHLTMIPKEDVNEYIQAWFVW